MTYNELAQVLETKNPKTGKLYTLDDLNVITMEDAGTAMLEDGVFVAGDWIDDEANQDIAKGSSRRRSRAGPTAATISRSAPRTCSTAADAGQGHQTWQMNEINALIWPTPAGVGVMDQAAFARTADIAKQFGVIKKRRRDAYRTDLAEAAVAS